MTYKFPYSGPAGAKFIKKYRRGERIRRKMFPAIRLIFITSIQKINC